MVQQKQQGNIVAIITMVFLFGMISFVTNLAAPLGVIWKNEPLLEGSNFWGMMGNMMNFLAYFFFGIASGKLLDKRGYKITALTAVFVGFTGVLIQFLSGKIGVGSIVFGLPANFLVYLFGAFVSGISMCMLNTVVNPMLNTLGGGGNRGNQFIQVGGTFNSLVGTLTPMFVGALIGVVTRETGIADVNPVLFVAMGVFASAFIILLFVPIPEPLLEKKKESTTAITYSHSPWNFRHFVLGAIAIFVYVGIEIGIPGTMNLFLADTGDGGGGLTATIAGFVAGTYWFLMLIGRFLGASLGSKLSSKTMLTSVSCLGIVFILIAILSPITTKASMPAFTGSGFEMVQVPISAIFFVLCGLCTSIMWGGIFNLAVEGLGKYTAAASGIFMMMVVGGGVLPLIQNAIADKAGYMISYWVPLLGLAYLLYYALIGCKNVNKDIPVD